MSRDDTGATRRPARTPLDYDALTRAQEAKDRSESLRVEARMAAEEARWQRLRLRDTRSAVRVDSRFQPPAGAADG